MTRGNLKTSYIKRVEAATKTVTLVASLLYGTGLVTSTLHYSRHGVRSFDLLRVEYLVAGFWYLLPLFGGVLAIATAVAFFGVTLKEVPRPEKEMSLKRGDKIGLGVYVLLVSAGFMYGLPLALYFAARDLFSVSPGVYSLALLKILPVAIGFMLATVWVVRMIWMSAVLASAGDSDDSSMFVGGVGLFSGLLVTLLAIYSCYFALAVFPNIPSGLGGGKPVMVQFLLSPDQGPTQGFPERRGESSWSIPYELLLAGDKGFTVQTLDETPSVVELSRDAVLALRHVAP